MLVLTRKTDERIVITAAGERIEIVVIRVSQGQCRLGFKAADTVVVNRGEIQDLIDPDPFLPKEGNQCSPKS